MENNNSFWLNSFKLPNFNKLDKNINADVCIVGGGLTGITTAYYLSKKGYKVCLIEKDNLMSKTSGHTTAKITSQHGIFYKYLLDSKGKEFAEKYLSANEEAIKNIMDIINIENIDCDFEKKNAYIFTEKTTEVQKLKEEAHIVKKLGIVDCNYINKINLNLNIEGAIEFKNQAQFNPIKYANALIQSIIQNGSEIFENTRFDDYEKNNDEFKIFTNKKYSINSKYLVLTTRYPIINFPGYYFLKMYQEISYVLAIKPKNKFTIDGMYINSELPTLSIKTAKYNDEDIILIGGYTNKTGTEDDINLRYKYENLRKKALEIFGDFDILYKWNTEDCISLDKIPYIGEFSNFTENLFLATGFKKWGMTTSNIAANIITDKIINKQNNYEEIFKATRLEPIKNREELNNMIKQSIKSLVVDKFKNSKDILNDVKNDEGKIVMFGDVKVGIYKDPDGNVYAIKPFCTHLGCELSWNELNKTWDCPCHGSRFEYTGKSIDSPSIKDLENYNFE
ncbi:MAG: FAD-dependent oxidoreductase [Clostridia bacterium]|nr:FAD-dependent oxidoreductase [Clostridia bacterium]